MGAAWYTWRFVHGGRRVHAFGFSTARGPRTALCGASGYPRHGRLWGLEDRCAACLEAAA